MAAQVEACVAGDGLSCMTPIIPVRDLAVAMDHYESKLGFSKDWVHGDPPDFGSVSRDAARIFLCEGCSSSSNWMMVFHPDVDTLHAEMSAAGAHVTEPVRNMPWGVREFHVRDLDGNTIRFGGPVK